MILTANPISLWPIIQRLQAIFHAQGREVQMRLRRAVQTGEELTLAHWSEPMYAALRPLMTPHWQAGIIQGKRELDLAVLRAKGLRRAVRKDFSLFMSDRTFTLFNPSVLDAIDQATMLFCQVTNSTATTDLNTAIARLRGELKEGIAGGEAHTNLARRVQTLFADPGRARTIAVTECLPGDTLISGANINGAYRRWYSGPVFKLVTKNGLELTGTPNHPVLTLRGWIALGQLDKSDYLVTDSGSVKNSVLPTRNKNVDAPPATLDQIFNSLSAVGVRSREITGHPDFHGDGRDGYVDVLRSEGVLRYGRLATVDQLLKDFVFSPSDVVAKRLECGSNSSKHRFAVDDPNGINVPALFNSSLFDLSDDSPSVCSELRGKFTGAHAGNVAIKDFLNRNGCELSVLEPSGILDGGRFGSASSYASSLADVHDNRFVASKFSGDHERATAVPVSLDRIRSLVRTQSDSAFHVYNLSTEDGYYVANGLYTKNSSRATNGGSIISYQKSGVCEGSAWSTTTDPCDFCAGLDGEERAFGEPFAVKGKGPYAVIYHPPAHPHCYCVSTPVLAL